jgi:hypothetical protein
MNESRKTGEKESKNSDKRVRGYDSVMLSEIEPGSYNREYSFGMLSRQLPELHYEPIKPLYTSSNRPEIIKIVP